MRRYSASVTAELAAMVRAVACQSRILQTVVNDPYAHHFCGYRTKPALLLNRLFELIDPALTHIRLPMVQVGLLCALSRHRFIEQFLIEKINTGVKQVVLLGAGYDTKSIRLKFDDIKYFEVDHPLTQKRKKSIFKKNHLEVKNTQYIPCDLDIGSPFEELLKSNFNQDLPVVVIAEGLLSYLEKEMIAQLIENFILQLKNVTFIFDYRHPQLNNNSSMKIWYNQFKRSGETYRTLLTSDEMAQLVLKDNLKIVYRNDLYDLAKEQIPTFAFDELKNIAELIVLSNE